MTLLTPGFWPDTYWSEDYWADDYWADYGSAVGPLLNAGYWHTTYWPRAYWAPSYWPKYGAVSGRTTKNTRHSRESGNLDPRYCSPSFPRRRESQFEDDGAQFFIKS